MLVCLGTILNYLARHSLSVLAPELKQVFAISTQQYSYIVGAFQIGYTIMQPVCGFVVDLIGLRLGFALFAMLWSVVGVAHGFASGWLSLGVLRGFLGLFKAAAIPAGMKAVAEWFRDREKSIAVGYFNAGTSLGFVWAALWYTHSSGQTLGAQGAGQIVDAAPIVGDSQQLTPSTTHGQFVGMAGIAVTF